MTFINSAEIESTYLTNTWQRRSYDDYVSIILAKDSIYPCIYAAKGLKGNQQLFIFIDSENLSERRLVDAIGSALRSYLRQSRRLGPNTSLVIPTPRMKDIRPVEEYKCLYWEFLKDLAHADHQSWPKMVPKDIDTPQWCFCFDGEPLFSAVLTPAHHQRHSRFSPFLCVVFQPKWIFDILFSTPQKRVGAIDKVQGLLKSFDDIAISPDMKNYGNEDSRESRQYSLLDENTPAICPFADLTV